MPEIADIPGGPMTAVSSMKSAAATGPPPNAAFLMLAGGRLVRERVEAALALQGTSLRQLAALGHLKSVPGLSYSELGRRAGVTAQSMQATLHQLETRGAVERRTPPGRGRIAQLHLTAAGLAVLDDANTAIDKINDQILSELTAEERQPATALLFRIFTGLHHDRPADTGT